MAKKLTGFADAMSEALMGRPAQESTSYEPTCSRGDYS